MRIRSGLGLWGMSFVAMFGAGRSIWAQAPADFGAKPTFREEFSGKKLDLAKWDFRGLGKRGNCVNTESAARVANGYLTITTYSERRDGDAPTNFCTFLSTEKTFLQRYGYWEASVRFHAVPGFQCAFWTQSPTIGAKIGNPQASGVEMDIFEHLAERSSTEYDHALHWDGYLEHHRQNASNKTLATLNDGKFHTFGLAWRPTGYTFYVDGQVTYETSATQVPVSDAPEYIILSTEVPRKFPAEGFGGLKESQATFDVDYVRVYPYKP